MHSDGEIPAFIVLVHVAQVIIIHVFPDSLGGNRQVIVRNLRKEQMVRNVTVSNMVMNSINTIAISAIHSLEGSGDEGPVFIAVYLGLVVVVLQVGHSHQPPAEHHIGTQVVVCKGCEIVKIVQIRHQKTQHHSETEVALVLLLCSTLLPHALCHKWNIV